jgi:hypothetical protein
MRDYPLSELKAKRDAIDKQIADHEPLSLPVAIKKVCAYATEHSMTEDDLFPPPKDPNADPYAVDIRPDDSWEDPDYVPFPEFRHPDTFGYIFIEDLRIQREKLHRVIRSIRWEAIGRARAFIREYNLTKKDICPTPG